MRTGNPLVEAARLAVSTSVMTAIAARTITCASPVRNRGRRGRDRRRKRCHGRRRSRSRQTRCHARRSDRPPSSPKKLPSVGIDPGSAIVQVDSSRAVRSHADYVPVAVLEDFAVVAGSNDPAAVAGQRLDPSIESDRDDSTPVEVERSVIVAACADGSPWQSYRSRNQPVLEADRQH